MLRLYKPLLAAAALLAFTAAGCGSSGSSSSTTSSTQTNANGKTTTKKKSSGEKKQAKQPQDPTACGTLGITPETTKEGTCNLGQAKQRHSVTYANGDGTLKLKELDIKVNKVSKPSTISGPAGTIKPVTGKEKGKKIPRSFIVVDLTWKNNDTKTQKLNDDGKQLRLQTAGGGGAVFMPGERADADSLFNAKPVKPGDKQKAQAVFQVATKAAAGVKLRGANPQLAVWEFSTSGKQQPPNGFIRLWNV